MSLQWTPDLATGIGIIDQQHQELFGRVNGLLAAMAQGRGRQEVGNTVAFLEQYVVEHFGAEETMMTRTTYPDLAAHKSQHAAFIADFTALKREYDAKGISSYMVLQLQTRVCDWLKTHIAGADKALGAHLRQRGY